MAAVLSSEKIIQTLHTFWFLHKLIETPPDQTLQFKTFLNNSNNNKILAKK